jgi:predicted dienelactone hydrolase
MRLARLAALTWLLAAPLAWAAPSTCLTDPFVLGDQRALAALRAATDAACPCEASASGRAYQRCARDVIDAALGSGALRPDCKKEARRVARGAACGTTKVPCGQVRRRDGAFDCKLSRPARCTDKRAFDKTACGAETHCADVVDWTAGTCFDPRTFGPFVPGFREISYVKDSVVSPGTPRTLLTSIWYPAPPGSGPIAGSGGVNNAPLDPSGGPYPLVLFSHGSCGIPRQSLFLTPLLASWGFVVVAPPHPGNTTFEFPACGTPAVQANSFLERPQDMVFVLDRMLAADADPASPFFAAIDEDRIAMTGHSFGGLTTYLVTAIEPRIKVAIPMAPAATPSSSLPVPSLTVLGNIDSVVNNPNARAAFGRSVSPKLLVEVLNAGHYAFSNACFPGSDCNPPVTLTQAEAHAAVLRYVLPFLKVYLEGDAAWAPLLGPPAQPGFVYTAG